MNSMEEEEIEQEIEGEPEGQEEGNLTTASYNLIDSVGKYELRLYTSDIDNIHYEIIDTSNDPPDQDLVYKYQGEAFREWKRIKKTILANDINKEIKELRKGCDKIVAAAKNQQGSLFNPDDEEGNEPGNEEEESGEE